MTMNAKYPGRCADCGKPFPAGAVIKWSKTTRKAAHVDCHLAEAMPTAPGNGSGASNATVPPGAPAVTLETIGRRIYARGDTYPIRNSLRAAGAHWDSGEKAWWIGTDKRADLEQTIASATPEGPQPYRPSRCKQCGRQPNQRGWPRIYRSGICSDCYRDEREEAEMGY